MSGYIYDKMPYPEVHKTIVCLLIYSVIHVLCSCVPNAERCPVFPYLTRVDVITQDNRIGGTASITCHPGYRFQDGSSLKNIRCTSKAKWTNIQDCYCEWN